MKNFILIALLYIQSSYSNEECAFDNSKNSSYYGKKKYAVELNNRKIKSFTIDENVANPLESAKKAFAKAFPGITITNFYPWEDYIYEELQNILQSKIKEAETNGDDTWFDRYLKSGNINEPIFNKFKKEN